MSTPTRTSGRHALVSFRLGDLDEGLRQKALDKLLRTDGTRDGMLVPSFSLTERIALGVAASRPSDRVYWVLVRPGIA